MKAKDCLTCKHHSLHGKYGEILVCAKGHKPRFYMPRDNFDFGWKRRCLDFEVSENVEVLVWKTLPDITEKRDKNDKRK